MKKFSIQNSRNKILSACFFIALWLFLARIIDNSVILPNIVETGKELVKICSSPDFPKVILATLGRIIISFSLSILFSIIFAMLAYISPLIKEIIRPIVRFFSSVPIVAIILLILIWFRNEFAPMIVGFLMIFPILYETVSGSITRIDKDLLEMANLFGVNKIEIIKRIYAPSIYFSLSEILTTALSTNMKMVIAGEVLAQPAFALGSKLQSSKVYLDTTAVFAWIIIILIISMSIDWIIRLLRVNRSREWM